MNEWLVKYQTIAIAAPLAKHLLLSLSHLVVVKQHQLQAVVAQTAACLVVYLVVVDVAMLLQTAVACLAD